MEPLNISFVQGESFSMRLALKNTLERNNDGSYAALDLTGATVIAQLRSDISSEASAGDFTCTIEMPTDDGIITVEMPPDESADLTLVESTTYENKPTIFAYDVMVTLADSQVFRAQYGTCSVTPAVSHV